MRVTNLRDQGHGGGARRSARGVDGRGRSRGRGRGERILQSAEKAASRCLVAAESHGRMGRFADLEAVAAIEVTTGFLVSFLDFSDFSASSYRFMAFSV